MLIPYNVDIELKEGMKVKFFNSDIVYIIDEICVDNMTVFLTYDETGFKSSFPKDIKDIEMIDVDDFNFPVEHSVEMGFDTNQFII